MEFYYLLSGSAIAIGIWNILLIIWAKNPNHLDTAVGTLLNFMHSRNVKTKHGATIPNITRYRYIYHVNGKPHRISGSRYAHKRTLFKKVTVVYIKGLPQVAYIGRFTGEMQWVWGICSLFLGCLLLWTLHTAA